jgi:energy-coupling factor transporter ATP-binding protein EcfA2
MDRFVINRVTKESSDFLGNQVVHDIVKNIVETNEIICLYGDSGVGKTHLVTHIMKGRNWVDLGYEFIKNSDFMDRLKSSECHVVIDDLESDSHLTKDIFDTIRTGGKLSLGSLIIVARNLNKVDFCNGVHFDHIDVPTMVTLGRKSFPKETLRRLEFLAEDSQGNVRNFLYSIQFSDKRDIFKTPRDFITDLLCEGSNVNPLEYFGKSIPEHGYIWDIVHENYVDSSRSNLVFMSECMSQSDILDTEIYKGNWSLIPLFSTISTVMPAFQMNHTLGRATLRSGSAWTKFGNFKMRDMKVRSMSNRCGYKIDFDAAMVIKSYVQHDKEKAIDLCKFYKLGSPDMDVINHLAVVNKLKPKELQSIKKSLKALAAS